MRLKLHLLLPLLIATPPAIAQAPAFEVASVKPSTSIAGRPPVVRDPGGGFTATNVSLETLILLAYQTQSYQLKGGPGWLRSDKPKNSS
jgi:uncharacterized protein (TIGR03435 family)